MVNQCRPEETGTKEYGKMKKRVPDRNARGWKVEGRKENHQDRVPEAEGAVRSGRFSECKKGL